MNVRIFLTPCDGMHVCRDLTRVYTLTRKSFGEWIQNNVNSKGKMPSTGKILPRGGFNPRCYIKQDSQPKTLPVSYSGPPDILLVSSLFNIPSWDTVYVRDRSALTFLHAATLKQKLQVKLAISCSQSILTPGKPLSALTV